MAKNSSTSKAKDQKLTRADARKLQKETLESINSSFAVIMTMLENQSVLLAGQPEIEEPEVPTRTYLSDAVELLTEIDVEEVVVPLAALGSTVRLEILRLCAGGPLKVRDIAERLGKGTTGQVYHHLRQLTVANWLRPSGKGAYMINEERLPQLKAILTSAN